MPQDAEMKNIVKELEKEMGCNCDLDRWEPEHSTGHSWVCRIHEAALRMYGDKRRARVAKAGGDHG